MQFIQMSTKMPSPLDDERSYYIIALLNAPLDDNFAIRASKKTVSKPKLQWGLADQAGLAECFYCKAHVVMEASL